MCGVDTSNWTRIVSRPCADINPKARVTDRVEMHDLRWSDDTDVIALVEYAVCQWWSS